MSDNNLKKSFEKINMPEDCKAVALKDILQTAHSLRNKEKENYTMNNKWKFAIAGVSLIACITFAVLALPQVINTQENLSQVAIDSPAPTQSEYTLPVSHSYQLCSTAYQVGEWVYVANPNPDDGGIYKIREDGTNSIKISDDFADNVQVSDDWIYYTNIIFKENFQTTQDLISTIYKIRTDGSDKTQLLKREGIINYFIVHDDWIYFSDPSRDRQLYRISTDGQSEMCILNNIWGHPVTSGRPWITKEWIFYIGFLKEDDKVDYEIDGYVGIIKSRLDGTEKTLIYQNWRVENLTLDGDYLYFNEFDTARYSEDTQGKTNEEINNARIDISKYQNFWKIKIDGTEKQKIIEGADVGSGYAVKDNWIYYCPQDENIELFESDPGQKSSLYRIYTDGTQKQKIYEYEGNDKVYCVYPMVAGDWIYLQQFNFTEVKTDLYKVKQDGTQAQKVDFGVGFNPVVQEQLFNAQ